MLRQIIIYNQYVFSVVHKIFGHSGSRIRGYILKRRHIAGGRWNNYSIIHCSHILEVADKFCNRRSFLSNSHIDTYNVFAFLINYCISRYWGFSSLSVPDYKLTLTPADRKHAVYRKYSGFQRNRYRLSFNNSRRRAFNWIEIVLLYLTLSVYRVSYSVNNPAD